MLCSQCRFFSNLYRSVQRTTWMNDFLEKVPQLVQKTSFEKQIRSEKNTLLNIVNSWKEKRLEMEQVESLLEENDGDLKELVTKESAILLEELEDLTEKLCFAVTPLTEYDNLENCQIEFSPGIGGIEAALFSSELIEMYRRFAFHKGWDWKTLEGDEKNGRILAVVSGKEAYLSLRNEAGIHRVQRVPITDKSRVHTSTASITVMPEPEDIDYLLTSSDVKMETMRASGPGGQNVNKRSTAVRLVHRETKVSVKVMDERYQEDNIRIAYKRLASILLQQKIDSFNEQYANSRKLQVGSKARSEKIRTYNFKENRLTDHRLKKSWKGIDEMFQNSQLLNEIIKDVMEAEKLELFKESINSLLQHYDKECIVQQ